MIRVSIEQKNEAGAWVPYFDWYCRREQTEGSGAVRSYQLEGPYHPEWEQVAGLDNHSEGVRVIYPRTAELQQVLLIDDVLVPEQRRGGRVTVTAHEDVE